MTAILIYLVTCLVALGLIIWWETKHYSVYLSELPSMAIVALFWPVYLLIEGLCRFVEWLEDHDKALFKARHPRR